MTEMNSPDKTPSKNLDAVENQWGANPENNFGYASEDERRANRGLEDWEMLDAMSRPQPGVFAWLHTVVGAVMAGVAIFVIFAYAISYVVHHYGPYLLGKG